MDISRGVSAHPPWVVHGEPFLQRSLVFATFVGAPGIVYASRFRRPRFGPKVLRLGALLGKVAGPEKCNIVGHTLRQKVQHGWLHFRPKNAWLHREYVARWDQDKDE